MIGTCSIFQVFIKLICAACRLYMAISLKNSSLTCWIENCWDVFPEVVQSVLERINGWCHHYIFREAIPGVMDSVSEEVFSHLSLAS